MTKHTPGPWTELREKIEVFLLDAIPIVLVIWVCILFLWFMNTLG